MAKLSDLEKENAELATKLIQQINYFSNGLDKSIFEVLINSHRTLQASLIRCFQNVLFKYAKWHEEHPNYFDDRNKAAIEFAKAVAKIDIGIPCI